MKKRFTIVILFLICTSIFSSCKNINSNEFKIPIEKWALDNKGQSINGQKGERGVDINVKPIWNDRKTYSEVIVGVVDTGIDYENEYLGNSLHINLKEKPGDNVDKDKNGLIDDYLYDYHGTYISNIIKEICPNVKICSSKFLNATNGDAVDGVKAIQYAIDQGSSIINCSWSFDNPEAELYKLIEENENVLFVCAAGNSNLDLDKKAIYPASYNLDNVICVSAIDNQGKIYECGAYGKRVDIMAPGKDVLVTLPEGDQTFVDGTSVSSAFVTSAAALLKSRSPNIEAKEIKMILMTSVQKLDSLQGICSSEGCLNIAMALKLLEENI